jgi:glycosyltransferase involved in cell wall biosynthesis
MDNVKVSTLVVTNRPQFIEWWAWNIRKQSLPPTEVVVVSNHPDPDLMARLIEAEKLPTRFFSLPPNVSIGELRQKALDEATGSIITWFDDDDWQHSENIERMAWPIVQSAEKTCMVVYPLSHKLSVRSALVYPTAASNEPWLPSTATSRRIAQQCKFPAVSRAEDVLWLKEAMILAGGGLRIDLTGLDSNMNVMLVIHDSNVYSREWRQNYEGAPKPHPLYRFPYRNITQTEWDETLAKLKQTFGVEPPTP